MERLTKRNADGGISVEGMTAALEKLAAWEDMQEQRRLVELPCPLGERVYEITEKEWLRDSRDKLFSTFPQCQYPFWDNDGKDCPCAERTWPVHCKACEYYRTNSEGFCGRPYNRNAEYNIRAKLFQHSDIPNVGETVFLTAQEAEAALKAMEAKA